MSAAALAPTAKDASTPLFSNRILSCLKEPGERGDVDLALLAAGLRRTKSGRFYPFVDGKVPSLFVGRAARASGSRRR